MFRKRIWLGVSSVMVFLLVFIICATVIGLDNARTINNALGLSTTKVVNPGDPDYPGDATTENVDTMYFKSEFGEMNKENQAKLIEAAWTQNVNEEKEGAALLYNATAKDGKPGLPLKAGAAVSLFGHASVEPYVYAPGAGNKPEPGFDPDLWEAMEQADFRINETLYEALRATDTIRGDDGLWAYGNANGYEDPISTYTDTVKSSWQSDYGDAAIMVLTREAGEHEDMKLYDRLDGEKFWVSAEDRYNTRDQRPSSLALCKDEKDILNMLKEEKAAGKFGRIIVILNTAGAMEVDWLKDYDVDACLFVGGMGAQGSRGVASILKGETNPSGHVVDTYAVDYREAPATVNSIENTPKYENAAEISATINSKEPKTKSENGEWLSFQAESIYIGYRYYETRYEDAILNRGNATSAAGASKGANAWKYETEVVFPFGHGLSYTTFEQKLGEVKYDSEEDVFTVPVTVTNTGSVAGKSVVQVYAQTPYGDYERTNKVEKSAIQLVGFEKTKLLEPTKSDTVTVKVDRYLLASYDYTNTKGYIMSEGDYYLAIGDDAHDALNNVLKAKNATGLVNPDGSAAAGDVAKTYHFKNSFDSSSYRLSSNGVVVTNRFDDCDLNYWVKGAGTYLTRSDWNGTFPKRTTVTATEAMMEVLKGEHYVKPEGAPTAAEAKAVLGKQQGINFVTMKDVPYDDDKTWDLFINQMTLEELLTVVDCMDGREAVDAVGIRETKVGDGCDSLNGFYPFEYEDKTGKWSANPDKWPNHKNWTDSNAAHAATRYCSKTVLTGTWNKELYESRGNLYAEEALWCGKVESWCVGGDLHRSQFGGRNQEYMSECPNMSYLAAIPEVIAMQKKGMLAGIKHFAGNDQENQRAGVCVFFNEQAFREGSLRAFEGAIRVAGAKTLMQAFNRLGLKFASSSSALNIDVCDNEWGFIGHKETDAVSSSTSGYLSHYATMLAAGTDTFCYNRNETAKKILLAQIEATDDGNLVNEVRETAKNFFYAMSRSNAINGLSSDSIVITITPWWEIACYVAIAVLSVLLAGGIAMYVISKIKEAKAQ